MLDDPQGALDAPQSLHQLVVRDGKRQPEPARLRARILAARAHKHARGRERGKQAGLILPGAAGRAQPRPDVQPRGGLVERQVVEFQEAHGEGRGGAEARAVEVDQALDLGQVAQQARRRPRRDVGEAGEVQDGQAVPQLWVCLCDDEALRVPRSQRRPGGRAFSFILPTILSPLLPKSLLML